MGVTPDFELPRTNTLLAWSNLLDEALCAIQERHDEMATLAIRAIHHRTKNACGVIAPILDDDQNRWNFLVSVLNTESTGTTDGQRYTVILDRLEMTLAAVKVATYATVAFLLKSEAYDIDIASVTRYLAESTGLDCELKTEERCAVTNSHIPYPVWLSAIEEIIWNAKKYGASKIVVWESDERYCFGNDGRPLSEDQIGQVNNGGDRLYPDIPGTGSGIKLIKMMGFDYSIRQSAPEEQGSDIATVVQIKPL